jgi:hypothetical protein
LRNEPAQKKKHIIRNWISQKIAISYTRLVHTCNWWRLNENFSCRHFHLLLIQINLQNWVSPYMRALVNSFNTAGMLLHKCVCERGTEMNILYDDESKRQCTIDIFDKFSIPNLFPRTNAKYNGWVTHVLMWIKNLLHFFTQNCCYRCTAVVYKNRLIFPREHSCVCIHSWLVGDDGMLLFLAFISKKGVLYISEHV